MTAPRLLDLFCGAGGAAMGYDLAGFEVTGVDHNPQPNYPFEFIQADAFEVLADIGLDEFDAIHASPPCQAFTAYRRTGKVGFYPDHIAQTREMIDGLPYVIENVEGAPLQEPVVLCGSMFDMDIQRHRLFETNWPLQSPDWPCRHGIWGPRFPAATNRGKNSRRSVEIGVWRIPLARQQEAMGVGWMNLEELSEAIPPAYTRFIGEQLHALVSAKAAA